MNKKNIYMNKNHISSDCISLPTCTCSQWCNFITKCKANVESGPMAEIDGNHTHARVRNVHEAALDVVLCTKMKTASSE